VALALVIRPLSIVMDKTYSPQALEAYWLAEWAAHPTYFQPREAGGPYCIMLPPPNVTGSLHMGHGFQVSLMDALIRYHRMCGKKVLWQSGTDHAGIATQMLVERQLAARGQSRRELGRERFLSAVLEWKETACQRIQTQLKRLGASITPFRERFTVDAGFKKAVTKVFIQLYEAGLLYRGQRLVNWDPQLLTALSDLEVTHTQEQGALYYLRYPLTIGQGHLMVATTRPETLFADVAVAVHPEDVRYQALVGQSVQLPLMNRSIPIIADSRVDPTFGTGCVKLTPAHDFQDYAIAQTHQLPLINLFTPDAKLNEQAPTAYQGLDRFAARAPLVTALQTAGFLDRIEAHTLNIPRGDRSGAVLEPYLTDQWFIRMQPLAKAAIAAIQSGQVRFVPENWTKICLHWLENIEDWCISRQLWWGHRIPAWYGPQGEVWVGESEAAVRKQYDLPADLLLKQEEDVLDTWVSSALWPFVTLGWPDASVERQTFYPTDVLVTGFDIIFFWVARMIMMGLYLTDQVPFKTVYVTGLIRDHKGQKMSKSKGNVLDPLDIIAGISLEELLQKRTENLMQPQMATPIANRTRQEFPEGITAFGTDALRLTYYALATPSREMHFDLKRLAGFRHFCNKLWQATRFVLMHYQATSEENRRSMQSSVFDRWIRWRLQETIQQVHTYFETYRFDLIIQTLYEFVWYDYCDWYLEFAKPILKGSETATAAVTTGHTLVTVLETLLRLLHPFAPFITEALWKELPDTVKQASCLKQAPASLSQAVYPQVSVEELLTQADQQAIAAVQWLQALIRAIRRLRTEMGVVPSQKIPLYCAQGSATDQNYFKCYEAYIQMLARISAIHWQPHASSAMQKTQEANAVFTQLGELTLWIPLDTAIDKIAEIKRLEKIQQRLQQAITHSENLLNDTAFTHKAPETVVEKTRAQHKQNQLQLAKIIQQLALLRQ
jgi:valyl-tRNA synthetase